MGILTNPGGIRGYKFQRGEQSEINNETINLLLVSQPPPPADKFPACA
jgi:hypothetical protein